MNITKSISYQISVIPAKEGTQGCKCSGGGPGPPLPRGRRELIEIDRHISGQTLRLKNLMIEAARPRQDGSLGRGSQVAARLVLPDLEGAEDVIDVRRF